MPLATTLRLLAKARGLGPADLATAIPKAGAATVSAWLRGEKLPGREQLDALARTLGVPAGALLAELAAAFDPTRTRGEHELLAAYRAMNAKQQDALLELARGVAALRAPVAAHAASTAARPSTARGSTPPGSPKTRSRKAVPSKPANATTSKPRPARTRAR